jgi:asparagine synthetase B (glutamine-hydrolysing)
MKKFFDSLRQIFYDRISVKTLYMTCKEISCTIFESDYKCQLKLSWEIEIKPYLSIDEYQQIPLAFFEEIIVPLLSILPKIHNYVCIVKQRCQSEPVDGLTRDEAASILLYSIQWKAHEVCLDFILTSTFRDKDWQKLQLSFL